ncbi:MAG: AMIN domain-containing protein, partial [Armatimonadota bacterium]
MTLRITTALTVLTQVLLTVAAALAEPTAARVFLGKRELTCSPPAIREGDQVLVPLSIVDQLGVTCGPAAKRDSVSLTSAGGRTGEAPLVDSAGEKMLPLDAILAVTGGEAAWDEERKTATIRTHLQSVEFVDGTLKVNCSFPVTCTTRKWQSKLIVDVADAKIASEAREVYIGGPVVARARLGQYDPDTARVVLDLVEDADIALESKLPAAQLVFLVGRNLPKGAAEVTEPARPPVKPQAKQPYTINSIRFETVDDTRFKLIVETSSKATIAPAFGVKPPSIELSLIGATLADGIGEIEDTHPLLKAAKVSRVSGSKPGVKIDLNLTRIATYEASVAEDAVTLA